MEQEESANDNDLLLDNINLPINITLVETPKEVNVRWLLIASP